MLWEEEVKTCSSTGLDDEVIRRQYRPCSPAGRDRDSTTIQSRKMRQAGWLACLLALRSPEYECERA